ncbi:MAG: epoxyqueuosine reductase [Desulfosarcina sp.]|nr:epoxyqueuosine reductase [Desulfosarcina sp.]MBC2743478.1 epoxyqueuosine reductase [Desulfosarcina sp.]MBC2766388.1 epoxyqueuosine reductase [Desulfosarcina sp.]
MIRDRIVALIETVVADASDQSEMASAWKKPVVGFADAGNPLFGKLKKAVRTSHSLPGDLLSGARTVIAYFLPFDPSIPRSNHRGEFSSESWAVAYIETNRLIAGINERINSLLEHEGFRGTRLPATHNFDEEQLMSDWSHKHVAYIAGIGSFGRHHMLITKKGCCGRLGSVVTDAVIAPTQRQDRERCLFKYDGSCRKCEKRCPADALGEVPFHRHDCYDRLLENARLHERHGLADVCGKCAAIVPCSFTDPVKLAARKKSVQR